MSTHSIETDLIDDMIKVLEVQVDDQRRAVGILEQSIKKTNGIINLLYRRKRGEE